MKNEDNISFSSNDLTFPKEATSLKLVDSDHKESTYRVRNNSEEVYQLEKRLGVKKSDSTLPDVDFVLEQNSGLSKERETDKPEVKKALVLVKLNNKQAFSDKKEIKLVIKNNTPVTKAPKSVIMTIVLALFFITVSGMFIYSLIDAFIVYGQWSMYIDNSSAISTSALVNSYTMHWVWYLKPAYLFQYFFNGSLGPQSNTQQYAETAWNYSLSGFNAVSLYRFIHQLGAGQNLKSTQAGLYLYYPFIIQLIYSLIGLWICVSLTFVPRSLKSKTSWTMVAIAACFIII